ncbi:MAG: TlpA disulfide reductase family protein [Candidatus Margulisbacteria bacterium]|nr:TlpA disulfide reductase family protein [Candidatus Margulisiibacteriota bacterium]
MRNLLATLLLVLTLFCAAAQAENSNLKAGSAAPPLELAALDGKTIDLQSYAGHQPVILFFFTSWSKSCQDALAALQSLYANERNNTQVIAISFDKKSSELKNLVASQKIAFPIIQDKKLSLIDKYQIVILPTTICINKAGAVEKIFIDYDDNINKALSEWVKS